MNIATQASFAERPKMEEKVNGIRPPKPLVFSSSDMAASWKLWLQQFDWFAVATQLKEKTPEIQVATFMSLIGPEAIKIFNTFQLTEAESQSVVSIRAKFTARFAPTPNESYVRYVFFKLTQKEGEVFDDFLTSIRTQANMCDFGALTDSLLKDKIVFGINSDTVREKLLSEPNLTLEKAVQICKAAEQASNQLRDFKNESPAVNVVKSKKMVPKQAKKVDNSTEFDCKRCGTRHEARKCPAYNKKCNKCSKTGHFATVCRSKQQSIRNVDEATSENKDDSDDQFFISMINNKRSDEKDWLEEIEFTNKIKKQIKLDTGAQCNVISKNIAAEVDAKIKRSTVQRLISYSNHEIKVLGETELCCKIKGKSTKLKFVVVNDEVKTIMGKDSCVELGLIKRVNEIDCPNYGVPADIFKGLGCLKDFEYDIEIEEPANLKIHTARRIPHTLKQPVKKEIDQMVKLGVMESITEPTPAVSPLVIVRQNGKFRICMDPSDLNKYVKRQHFPLKTVEEITSQIQGAKYFTKLDCYKGFWQIKVTPRTSKYLTVATPWGRFSFKRIPFGLSSAPEVFQQVMTKLVGHLDGVHCSMDDILIYGDSLERLRARTKAVMQTLYDSGLKLNKDKCLFEQKEVTFLGHILSSTGVKIDPRKVEAINLIKIPTNKKELQRFLGMTNYVAKFIPNYSTVTEPLRSLLLKEAEWLWEEDQELAMTELKNLLKKPPVLAYYDVNKDVVISADASSTAVGAVLLQEGKPVAYATKALTETQKNYPQIEKEAFALRFGVQKFHEYVIGKRLIVETDHKPLEAIAKKTLDKAPPRLQRLLFDVMQYAPTIVYKKGNDIPVADTLSRDCLAQGQEIDDQETLEVCVVLPMSSNARADLIRATKNDIEMVLLAETISNGWPDEICDVPDVVKKYWNYRDELSVYNGINFKNDRPIVPFELRNKYLEVVHQGHLGIQSSLRRAREAIFWPNMCKEVENYVQKCFICETNQRKNNKEAILLKPIPDLPWQVVASDLFYFQGKDYLLVADSYSGFFEFEEVKPATSEVVIMQLKKWFSIHGVPEVLETNHGPQYHSAEFVKFTKEWGFRHQISSPHFPRSNGLAERYVQISKNMLRKCKQDSSCIHLALLNIRNVPGENNLPSAAQRLFSRRTRTTIPTSKNLLLPEKQYGVKDQIIAARQKGKEYADKNASPTTVYKPGDQVRISQNFGFAKHKWEGGTVLESTGDPRSYLVQNQKGRVFRRNTFHLHKTNANFPVQSEPAPLSGMDNIPDQVNRVNPGGYSQAVSSPTTSITRTEPSRPIIGKETVTRSGRVVKAPMRLDL